MARADGSGRAPVRVIYLTGTGRSGSTLLGNAVGSLPGAISVGEVRFLLRRGLAEGGRCGCRELVTDCPVWRPALEKTFGAVPGPEEVRRMDATLTALTRRRRVRWWAAGGTSPEAEEMGDLHGRLLANLAETSGATTIVDSSKIATFGALLSRSPLLDVRPVHLVRDPRAVAYSWQREVASQAVEGYDGEMERFHAGKAAAMWLHSTISVGTTFSRRGRSVLDVRYEDFVSDPAAVLRRIAEFAGLPADTGFVRDGALDLSTSHAVAGNPNRMRSGPVSLRADTAWKSELRTRDRLVVSAVTTTHRRAHGY
ncbi:sulfotransferase family protein [Nocardioides silvaticus]|uniref:Sulfotransferase family protein n=1 Tax=Nocardioides silvaticus TaxID=2201891 RepID=A0A316TXY5_9ACTN|nr:sulfotransferase [Nocardioides silvaticus]PWN04606.1 sulfotransferase family protein [Nocardioides silvaticus]